jgi:non-specific serine/threonine protein kinase
VAETAVAVDAARARRESRLETPGAAERRVQVLGAIETMREATSLARAPQQRAVFDGIVADLRKRLAESSFAASWAAGRTLSPDSALEQAIGLLAARESAVDAADGGDGVPTSVGPLTPREAEIAALIAQGRTSKEIAAALVITERTADTHASHIRDKLGLGSRAEIAAWAVRHGLLKDDTPARR